MVGIEACTTTKNAMATLAEGGRAGLMKKVLDHFSDLMVASRGEVRYICINIYIYIYIYVYSARPLQRPDGCLARRGKIYMYKYIYIHVYIYIYIYICVYFYASRRQHCAGAAHPRLKMYISLYVYVELYVYI